MPPRVKNPRKPGPVDVVPIPGPPGRQGPPGDIKELADILQPGQVPTVDDDGNLTALDPSADGITGPTGPRGSQILDSTGVPAGGTGQVGDWVIRRVNGGGAGDGDTYEKTAASTWTQRGNIKGPAGAAGAAGAAGTAGAAGATGTAGAKGDPGADGAKGDPGDTGPRGSQILDSTGVPAGGTGQVGDWVIRRVNGGGAGDGDTYEKTAASTWTQRGNIKGPAGATGSPGTTGSVGPAGPSIERTVFSFDGIGDGNIADIVGADSAGGTLTKLVLRAKDAANRDQIANLLVNGTRIFSGAARPKIAANATGRAEATISSSIVIPPDAEIAAIMDQQGAAVADDQNTAASNSAAATTLAFNAGALTSADAGKLVLGVVRLHSGTATATLPSTLKALLASPVVSDGLSYAAVGYRVPATGITLLHNITTSSVVSYAARMRLTEEGGTTSDVIDTAFVAGNGPNWTINVDDLVFPRAAEGNEDDDAELSLAVMLTTASSNLSGRDASTAMKAKMAGGTPWLGGKFASFVIPIGNAGSVDDIGDLGSGTVGASEPWACFSFLVKAARPGGRRSLTSYVTKSS